ncbi:RNase H domain-containing protein [Trichonephila clavipes]|nr:RNase H domain-containing protein [Trichonephila clavipes]
MGFFLHVNFAGNEIADALAKDGAAQPPRKLALFIYSKLHSTYINNKQSTISPAHHWYEAKRPGSYLSFQYNRQGQTILTSLWSAHLRPLTFKNGNKVLPTGVRCSACQVYPEHILDCLGLTKQDLYEDHLMVLDILRVSVYHGFRLVRLDMEMSNKSKKKLQQVIPKGFLSNYL